MGLFSRGLVRSAAHKLENLLDLRTHPAVRARLEAHADGRVALPDSIDLAQFEPPRGDQDGTSTCFAHATAWSIATAFAAAGQPLGYVPSPAEVARITYALERAMATPAGQPLPMLVDQGAELADVMTAIARIGIVPMAANVDGRNSDATPSSVTTEPAVAELELAAEKLIVGPYSINPNAPDVSDVVAAALTSGIPVVLGVFVDTAFEQLAAGQIARPPNIADPNGGGHAMYLSGYELASDGTRTFRVSNSWGSSWCDGGRCLAGEAWLRSCWELFPCAVAKKGAS